MKTLHEIAKKANEIKFGLIVLFIGIGIINFPSLPNNV